ncbi:uncharacterized protein [Malus domestica]|uniref:uncharacterized protein n=1 Tax=Malus domestica TaxID=3750 RepID=UPI003974833D
MKIICWNCQGIGGDLTVDDLLEQNRLHSPEVVAVLETKNHSRRYRYLKRRLDMACMHVIEQRGIAGAQQLSVLFDRIAGFTEPCFLMGDLNDVLSDSEKEGGNVRTVASIRTFRNFVAQAQLLDLGFEGYPYTWRNRREEGFIQERIDCALASKKWVKGYQQVIVKHVILEGSDHAILLLSTEVDQPRRKRRFMYDPRWNQEAQCNEVVRSCWGNRLGGVPGNILVDNLKRVHHGLDEDEDNVWCTNEQRMHNIDVRYFNALFATDQPANVEEIMPFVPCKVGQMENNLLIAQVSDVEIESVVHQMYPTKSLGPDGFNAGFFQHHWETVGGVVLEQVGRINGISVNPSAEPISHVFFTDDSVLFCRATEVEELGICHQEGFGKYLGIQADFGASKKKVFEDAQNRLDDIINGDQKTKKGIHWMAWNRVAKKKSLGGGLGFKEIIAFNVAMLAKVGWRIICKLDSLLTKVLKEKYFPSSTFLDATVGRGTLWGWKGILQGRNVLKAGLRWRVGDCRSVKVLSDPWLPTPRTFKPLSRHVDMPTMVSEFVAQGGKWRMELVKRCFNSDEA